MRIADITTVEVSNGEGVGLTLWVQGCHFHCRGCHNVQTWDFNDGYEFTNDLEQYMFEALKKPQVTRFTLCGGEPLCEENRREVIRLAKKAKEIGKEVWLFTGYYIWEIDFDIRDCFDVIVDGRFIYQLRDTTLAFRGSKNQTILKQIVDNYYISTDNRVYKFMKKGVFEMVIKENNTVIIKNKKYSIEKLVSEKLGDLV